MKPTFLALLFLFSLGAFPLAYAASSLSARPPIALPGAAGKFDFMSVDPSHARILAAHRDAKTLEIIDLKTSQPLKPIRVGAAQGVAIDAKGHRYFLGNESDHTVVWVNSKTLKKTGQVTVDGPVDAIAFDDKNGLLYAAEDDGDHLWVIDPRVSRVVGKISIPGEPEVLEFDGVTNQIYLNIKDRNSVVRIDPATSKVSATWSTLPATAPHGLVIDSKRGRVYTAGGNGKLVAIDLKTGQVVSTVDIPHGVDQIAFDVDQQVIYSACKGFISMTKVSDAGLKEGAKIPSPKGAHTLAIDPVSHDVWVSYADEHHSYFQQFKAEP